MLQQKIKQSQTPKYLKSFQKIPKALLVPNPPENKININAIFAICWANFALSKDIFPVTSLPEIIPVPRAIIINGTFNFLEIKATKTMDMSIKEVINRIKKP